MFFLNIPKQIDIKVGNNWIKIKGPLGTIIKKKSPTIKLYFDDNAKKLYLLNNTKFKHFYFSLITNIILGVNKGYQKVLNIVGIGYKANIKGKILTLRLGFSHDVIFNIPEDININILDKKLLTLIISGNNLQKVNQIAADIRNLKLPEPYKGKGIRYQNEIIKQKEGKKTNV